MNPEPSAELADPACSQTESLGHGTGLLAQRQCPRDPPVPRRETAKPIRQIQARRGRFGRTGVAIFA